MHQHRHFKHQRESESIQKSPSLGKTILLELDKVEDCYFKNEVVTTSTNHQNFSNVLGIGLKMPMSKRKVVERHCR